MSRYWVSINGEVKGPYPPEEIRKFENCGGLLCAAEGTEEWKRADAIEEIRGASVVSSSTASNQANAATTDSRTGWSHMQEGMTYANAGKFPEAIRSFQ